MKVAKLSTATPQAISVRTYQAVITSSSPRRAAVSEDELAFDIGTRGPSKVCSNILLIIQMLIWTVSIILGTFHILENSEAKSVTVISVIWKKHLLS